MVFTSVNTCHWYPGLEALVVTDNFTIGLLQLLLFVPSWLICAIAIVAGLIILILIRSLGRLEHPEFGLIATKLKSPDKTVV